MKKKSLLMLAAVTPWILAGCNTGDNEAENNENTLEVYTTVYPLQYFTEEIGGEYVSVETIYPPGADEHTFEPSQRDMIDLAEGDIFFYIGLGLEGFVDNATDVLESEDLTMVAAADAITDEELEAGAHEHEEESAHDEEEHAEDEDHSHEDEHAHDEEEHAEEGHEGHNHGNTDPHVWLDPVLSQSLAESVKDTLIEKMPEQEAVFTENYENLVERLDELDHQFEELASDAELNQFFVSHAAYSYWESRYGIEQQAIAGISTTDEPSQRELTELIESASEQNVEYLLVEQNVSSNLTDVIQSEIGAETLPLHNLSVLTDEDIANEETYFSLMERNIESLGTAMRAE
ncbi:metal ABC transporter solute-binding protein, Zn/Mn family [Jeotgalibacillus terrae]|uniref:Metal ABC transporter solute-binding protein, Zn/Mn family n=1 Tax=Jeotgalibacillus terrae TaxID=587735 RepID=A0ABW5ZE02_9BACL|nr:zinc ABC transporter substrate-binding protein [Jeotgalibacillus terrae]MBM7581001.1 zinc transport system substrate-binding protein [Jeotgalibacillus terrae]